MGRCEACGDRATAALSALDGAYGFIRAALRDRGVTPDNCPESIRELLTEMQRAMGALCPPSSLHDRGAIARCSGCRRYTASAFALSVCSSALAVCDCGRADYWSGSFAPPGEDSTWSTGLARMTDE